MPYIKQEKRAMMDDIVLHMINNGVKADGDLNYILFKFAKSIPPTYNNYKNLLGELNEAAEEIRRRLLASYEDEACKRNGDIN